MPTAITIQTAIALLVLAVEPSGGDPLTLTWQAPVACPDASAVRAAVATFLDDGVRSTAVEPGVRVQGEIVGHDEGFTLTMDIESDAGTSRRTLVAGDCAVLGDAAALMIAVALDPVASAEAVKPDPPPPPPVASASPPAPSPPSPAPITVADRRPRPALRAQATFAGALLPGLTTGGEISAGAIWRHARLEIGLAAAAAATPHRPFEGRTDVGVRYLLFAALVRGCALPRIGPIELPLCAAIETGFVRALGFATGPTGTSIEPWAAAAVGPALAWAFSRRVALWLQVEALISIVRPGFSFEDLGPAFRAPAFAGRGAVGLDFRFR